MFYSEMLVLIHHFFFILSESVHCWSFLRVLTLFDEEVGQRQHDGVTAVQEVTAHQVRAGQRQTCHSKHTTVTSQRPQGSEFKGSPGQPST